MIGLQRLAFAVLGSILRFLARAPISCGEALLRSAARCERLARPPLERRPGR